MTHIAFILFVVTLICALGIVRITEEVNFDVTVWAGKKVIRHFECWTFEDTYDGIRFYTQLGC
jgi:hypothetical protein